MLSFNVKSIFQSENPSDDIFEFCNGFSFQLDKILSIPAKRIDQLANAVICQECGSYDVNKICVFCDPDGRNNLPFQTIVDYEKPMQVVSTTTSTCVEVKATIVFCIDVSGSMNGERIDMVRDASLKTIEMLKKKAPSCKVALITFESQAYYWGDAKSRGNSIANHNCLQEKNVNLRAIEESYRDIKYAIESLNAGGGTNICAALAESVCIGTEVVLCTDGEASDKNIKFYDEVIEFAKKNGKRINIVSFHDTSCDFGTLVKFATETNGKVCRTANAIDLASTLSQIAESAQNFVSGTFYKLLFDNSMLNLNNSSSPIVVNVTDKTMNWVHDVAFKARAHSELVFQLQITDGNKIRIITERKIVTNNIKAFSNPKNTKPEILFVKIINNITVMISSERRNFETIKKKANEFKDLCTKLSLKEWPIELQDLYDAIESQNGRLSINSLTDREVNIIVQLIEKAKTQAEKIAFENYVPVDMKSIECADLVEFLTKYNKKIKKLRQCTESFSEKLNSNSIAISVADDLKTTLMKKNFAYNQQYEKLLLAAQQEIIRLNLSYLAKYYERIKNDLMKKLKVNTDLLLLVLTELLCLVDHAATFHIFETDFQRQRITVRIDIESIFKEIQLCSNQFDNDSDEDTNEIEQFILNSNASDQYDSSSNLSESFESLNDDNNNNNQNNEKEESDDGLVEPTVIFVGKNNEDSEGLDFIDAVNSAATASKSLKTANTNEHKKAKKQLNTTEGVKNNNKLKNKEKCEQKQQSSLINDETRLSKIFTKSTATSIQTKQLIQDDVENESVSYGSPLSEINFLSKEPISANSIEASKVYVNTSTIQLFCSAANNPLHANTPINSNNVSLNQSNQEEVFNFCPLNSDKNSLKYILDIFKNFETAKAAKLAIETHLKTNTLPETLDINQFPSALLTIDNDYILKYNNLVNMFQKEILLFNKNYLDSYEKNIQNEKAYKLINLDTKMFLKMFSEEIELIDDKTQLSHTLEFDDENFSFVISIDFKILSSNMIIEEKKGNENVNDTVCDDDVEF